MSNEEQDLTVEGKVKSVLIENTLAQEVFEKQILVPWDAFCVEMTD
ncbi:glucan 1%2C6-alpha-glucosidase [Streptococcus pneumoniae]|nr:glucan 1%2C6-alpha-glucosidase [Streptococcus pneumoniae]